MIDGTGDVNFDIRDGQAVALSKIGVRYIAGKTHVASTSSVTGGKSARACTA